MSILLGLSSAIQCFLGELPLFFIAGMCSVVQKLLDFFDQYDGEIHRTIFLTWYDSIATTNMFDILTNILTAIHANL